MDSMQRNTRRGNKPVKLTNIQLKDNEQEAVDGETGEISVSKHAKQEEINHETEPFSISGLILHFVIVLSLSNFRPGPAMVYSILLVGRQMLFHPFTYVVPFFIGYLNIHLGGVYMATKFMSGPYEERTAMASMIGRIVHILARSKEIEWIKESITIRPDGYPGDSTSFNSVTEWCIVIVLLAMPRGLSIVMFIITLVFCSPVIKCSVTTCVPITQTAEGRGVPSGFYEELNSFIAQYGSIGNQLNMLTAFVCYCLTLTLLLYLSRYTRISGESLRDLLVASIGGLSLLMSNPFVGLLMTILCFLIINSEFYQAVMLGQDREEGVTAPAISIKPAILKTSPQGKTTEEKIRRARSRAQTSSRQEDTPDNNELSWEFLPWRVPSADSKGILLPNGKGGKKWHDLMGLLMAIFFPMYETALGQRLGYHKQYHEYATVLLIVAHPIVGFPNVGERYRPWMGKNTQSRRPNSGVFHCIYRTGVRSHELF